MFETLQHFMGMIRDGIFYGLGIYAGLNLADEAKERVKTRWRNWRKRRRFAGKIGD